MATSKYIILCLSSGEERRIKLSSNKCVVSEIATCLGLKTSEITVFFDDNAIGKGLTADDCFIGNNSRLTVVLKTVEIRELYLGFANGPNRPMLCRTDSVGHGLYIVSKLVLSKFIMLCYVKNEPYFVGVEIYTGNPNPNDGTLYIRFDGPNENSYDYLDTDLNISNIILENITQLIEFIEGQDSGSLNEEAWNEVVELIHLPDVNKI